MKAVQVEYRETVSKGFPSYSNQTVGIVLEATDGEKADVLFDAAKHWVRVQLGIEHENGIPF